MSGKEITIKENDIIRFKLRQGLSSELNGATISEGELVYTKDEKRVYVGTDSGTTTVGSRFIETFSGTPQVGDFWFETREQEIKGGSDKTGFLKVQTTKGQVVIKPALGTGLTYDENGKIAIDNVDNSIKKYFESGTKVLQDFKTKTLHVNGINFLPDENDYTSTELQMPDRIRFGDVTIKLNKPETQPSKKQYALALNSIGTTTSVLEAFFVPFPTASGGSSGGGGSAVELSFSDNFQVITTNVELSRNLKRIDSLSNSQGTKLDFSDITTASEINGHLCVSKQETGYKVFVSEKATPSGETKPYTLLKNAIPIAWTNNGKTAPTNEVDVRFQIVIDNSSATNGMPYCIKYNVTSYDGSTLPKGQPKMGDRYFENITSEQANIWNNSLAVIGCNNYGNLLGNQQGGKGDDTSFIRSISPHYSPEFLLSSSADMTTAVPKTTGQLLIAWYGVKQANGNTKYFIDSAFSEGNGLSRRDEVEISSIICNNIEIIDGSYTKIVSSHDYPETGITRYFVYDKTGESMSFVYTKAETKQQVKLTPFDNAISTKSLTRVVENEEFFYFINEKGKLEEIAADTINASDYQHDVLFVRSGQKTPEKDESISKAIYLQVPENASNPETYDIISKNEFYHVNSHASIPKTITEGEASDEEEYNTNFYEAEYNGVSGTSRKLYYSGVTSDTTGPALFGANINENDRFFSASSYDTDTTQMYDSFKTGSPENSFTRAKKASNDEIEFVINLSEDAMVNLVKLDTDDRVGFQSANSSGEPILYDSKTISSKTTKPDKEKKFVGILKNTVKFAEHEGNILLYFKRDTENTSSNPDQNFTRHGHTYSFNDCQVDKPTDSQNYDAIWCYAKPQETQGGKYEPNIKLAASKDGDDENAYFWFSIAEQCWINTCDIQIAHTLYNTANFKSIADITDDIQQLSTELTLIHEVKANTTLYLRKSFPPVIGTAQIQLKTTNNVVKGYKNFHTSLYEYTIGNSGTKDIIVPTLLKDVFYNASDEKVQVNEETPNGYETLQGASSVLLEVSNFTGNTIGLFTAPMLENLKQSENGSSFTASGASLMKTGYEKTTTVVSPNVPSFSFDEKNMFSPAADEKLLTLSCKGTTTIVEAPVQNGSIFLRATNIKGSESKPFFIRIIGYR